ncbi:CKLF-like MARVEL transmembrane domain-containing protein 2B [Peromyscus californicus insignis]|uniref:CKLF-like MARVEL transmembrane domain-containing protein 2B n=1 Tax=Peromyscus californicus insignis TaxID=564181 RepID=UPI0022A6AD9E|nr:CKLF-like MARVEL transmembrane domain-containing protein 2B [Peromyscus californicus insignis]
MAVPGQHKVQPKDDVGTRKGFDRYKWEFKDCNKDFWLGGHAVIKTLSIDLLNDLFTCVFLTGAIVFGVKSKSELTVTYIMALVLMALAAFFALVDLCLQRRHFKPRKLRKLHVLAPDKFGKMPDPNLKLLLEQKEEEEAKQKEKEEKEKKQREAKLKAKQKKKQAKAKKGKKKK